MGLYAKIVQSPEYRSHKMRTALDALPEMLGPDTAPFNLRFRGPDGAEVNGAHLILVSNGPYELSTREGFGSRRALDGGALGVVAATFRSSGDVARLLRVAPAGRASRFDGLLEWATPSFEVRSDEALEVAVDGEAVVLSSPVTFRVVPGAVRVRLPTHAPGMSPAAAEPRPAWATVVALARIAVGLPAFEGPPAARESRAAPARA
jgi:diacylglycerol kinase family enzyme